MNFRVSTIFGKNPFQELKIYGTNLRDITTSVLSRKCIFKKKLKKSIKSKFRGFHNSL